MKATVGNSFFFNKFEHAAGDNLRLKTSKPAANRFLVTLCWFDFMIDLIEAESGTLTPLSHLHVTSEIQLFIEYYTLYNVIERGCT